MAQTKKRIHQMTIPQWEKAFPDEAHCGADFVIGHGENTFHQIVDDRPRQLTGTREEAIGDGVRCGLWLPLTSSL